MKQPGTDLPVPDGNILDLIHYVMNVLLQGCDGDRLLAAILARATYTTLLLHSYDGNHGATALSLRRSAEEDAKVLETGVFDTLVTKITVQ